MKQSTFEIWQSEDGEESSLFSTEGKTQEQLDFLTQDTYGNKMILRKSFTGTYQEAHDIYDRFVEDSTAM